MKILVAGGAGFIGSHIVEQLFSAGHRVAVVDGLLPRTGGAASNLTHLHGVTLVTEAVETSRGLSRLLADTDVTIDCMGWTQHLSALKEPSYDLHLNLLSHVCLIEALKQSSCRKVIYLGSRSQIGNPATTIISDDAPRHPVDVQGIHKTAAESHYRLFAEFSGAKVVSTIIGNTFGERMSLCGDDIGLVGGFLRDAFHNRCILVYGSGRSREFTYAPDLAKIIARLCRTDWSGFQSVNVPGCSVDIESFVQMVVQSFGRGQYRVEELPAQIKSIDIGHATLCRKKVHDWLGDLDSTPITSAVAETVQYVERCTS